MDVFQAIRSRRSIRVFTEKQVSNKEVERLIDAARCAPSAGNIQPWEFVIVRDTALKQGLSKAALGQTFIEEAPVVIVVCANVARSSQRYGTRGADLYCIQDTAAATQTMLLAAQALRLATCWVGAFQEEEARNVLNIPQGVRPIAIIPVGHPAEKPKARPRRPLNDILHRDGFGRK